MHPRFCLLGLLAAVSVSTAPVPAQGSPAASGSGQSSPAVFRTSADLLTIDAVVTDDQGRHVTDLTSGDFEVTVAGKRQELQQAVYIRTADQPRILGASRAESASTQPPAPAPPDPRASSVLNNQALGPDRVARTMALVVDDLGLSFESTVRVRKALETYIDTQMQPGDLVAIVRTAGGIGALQQFTTDRRLLHVAADRVQWDFRSRHAVGGLTAVTTGGLVGDVDASPVGELRDSMASVGSLNALEYIARGVAELPGRKCIVLFSEGIANMFTDRGESGRIWRAMSRALGGANAAGVVVYTIDPRGLVSGALAAEDNPQKIQTGNAGTYDAEALVREKANERLKVLLDSQESLQFIAQQTGGLAITNTNDLNIGISRVLRDQDGYYLLGYVAPKGARRSGWDQNRVKVRVTRPGLHVRARQGFFGPSEAKQPDSSGIDPLTTAALSPFAATGVALRLSSLFGHDGNDEAYIRSLLFIEPVNLQWDEDTPGRHTATFQVNMLAIGDNGQVLAEWRRLVPVALNDEQFTLSRQGGILYSVRMGVKEPGAYQVRVAVRDANTKATGSASQYVEVPSVGAGRLAVSGVLLKGLAAPDTGSAPGLTGETEAVFIQPQVRILEPGTEAVYAYEIYDGLKPADGGTLQMATTLLRDGRVLYQSPFAPVATVPRQGHKIRTIPIAGKLALGADLADGPYTLEVIVRSDARKLERRQYLNFDVRR